MTSSSSSSTLVNVAEDAEIRLVRLLAQTATSPNFVQDCETSIANGDAAHLLKTIVHDSGALQALFVLPDPTEAVSAFSILTALTGRAGGQEESLTRLLADQVSNVQGGAADRKIALLAVLYNMSASGPEKCALLRRMIALATPELLEPNTALGEVLQEDEPAEGVAPSMPRIVAMLDAWQVPLAERRELYLAAARGLTGTRKQRFLLLFVESYKDASQIDERGLAVAKEAALGAIQDPVSLFIHQRSMLSWPLIQALPPNLHGLLKVFQEGKLSDYNAFVQANGGAAALLQPLGLSEETCIKQMRILSLCSLSAEHEEIPYSVVAKTLQLSSVKEVESWVIAAVSSGLLSAKMDQLQQKVMVERCVVRRFDKEQWKLLQQRLRAWKHNVGGVLQGLKQSGAGATAATAVQ